MTPQYILTKSLVRRAVCGSYDHDALTDLRSAQSEIDNLGYAQGYAEPGYDEPKKGILLANWNYFPRNIDETLERAGYAVEWSDEWATCDNCYKAVRTQPDSMMWTPYYVIENECEIICLDCKEREN